MEKVLQFLNELSENNNKEWFHANRKRYEENRDKVLFITEVLINEIRKWDKDIPVMNPKDCMFRIFRDVRFSKNKQPYKNNFGSFIAKDGRKSISAGYYFHIEPEGSFMGGGIYMPSAEPLKAIRKYIADHGDEFYAIINDKEFKQVYPEMYGDKLKTAPKGFPKDHEFIDLLRYKSFAFSTNLKKEELLGENFIENVVKAFRKLYNVNAFLNTALDKNM
ncbi:MAG: DUF2461 domain-containing protein [Prolixibacteraceae bacterium]|jgi:uncharacterized protein (TIGR02453 family)|nr:DUF2461 domain-containing protein [Prolixibacteraceae bacterium]MBT6005964.1 DUF2461 domain-containing protein [Prolixibacteraceae bacterium]MBT6764964.1 DUF2461 domain-containing protein [Prolixibacteraceae bacterium]MBT6997077.1 DUF2461 domain-containing protein [Prolixibacteraceae bacterium]MBT7396357.1 DUF2461 domain-containing protein [Prolixibacteraceae bacterium]